MLENWLRERKGTTVLLTITPPDESANFDIMGELVDVKPDGDVVIALDAYRNYHVYSEFIGAARTRFETFNG